MQLDKTRIAIRERDFPDIFDLSLQWVRAHFAAWLGWSLLGALPCGLINWWLLLPLQVPQSSSAPVTRWLYFYILPMAVLVAIETPLASAFLTRYIGHALFFDRPEPRMVLRDVAASLGQLLVEFILRGLFLVPALVVPPEYRLIPLVLLGWVPYIWFPFFNEIILLERNPLVGKKNRVSSWKRSGVFHQGARSDQFGRGILSLLVVFAMSAGFSISLWYMVQSFLLGATGLDTPFFTIYAPIGLWLAVSFFAVVRYLCYLDLRIRNEGWEVELLMRAEAARLTRQAT